MTRFNLKQRNSSNHDLGYTEKNSMSVTNLQFLRSDNLLRFFYVSCISFWKLTLLCCHGLLLRTNSKDPAGYRTLSFWPWLYILLYQQIVSTKCPLLFNLLSNSLSIEEIKLKTEKNKFILSKLRFLSQILRQRKKSIGILKIAS